jgi:hypothetical protein
MSPLLNLFVAEALACWLRQCPKLGVLVANQRHVSQHHADDTKVLLPVFPATVYVCILSSPGYVCPCLWARDTSPAAEAARVGPLTVVASKICLGVTFALASSSLLDERCCAGNGASQL